MRGFLTVFFLFFINVIFAQIEINAFVFDAENKTPIPYCNILLKGTTTGTITNVDGEFRFTCKNSSDSLIISFIGYKRKTLSAEQFIKNPIVYLEQNITSLGEFTVYSNDDFLYNIIAKCKTSLKKNHGFLTSKVYYNVESFSKQQPIELLECFYNGTLNGEECKELIYKNGRTALATSDGNYFQTFNTSKLICKISIDKENEFLPITPLQLSKRELRKYYKLSLMSSDTLIIHLQFLPKNQISNAFEGEIWINKTDYSIKKIKLSIKNTSRHPFIPIHQPDSIYDVGISITNTYKIFNNITVLDFTNFEYNFSYHSVRDTTMSIPKERSKILYRNIQSKGVVRYYDYQNPFILPYFDYPDDLYYGDYYKMTFIPYNKEFWKYNNQIVLSQQQKQNLNSIAKKGQLINYYDSTFINPTIDSKNRKRFEFQYSFWSPYYRVFLRQDAKQYETYSKEVINSSIKSDMYNFQVQILLDISRIDDSLICRTYTVFDNYKSYFHLPHDLHIYGFMNIYFDICEIERRKLDTLLHSKAFTISQIDSIYNVAIAEMERFGNQYFKEIKLGENQIAVQKWNDYVNNILGIDNLKLVEETLKNESNKP